MKYILAEGYRILRKKSYWIFMAVAAVIVCGAVYVVSGSSNGLGFAYMLMGNTFIEFACILLGTLIFALVYTDDFKARALPAIVAGGKNRIILVTSKTLIALGITLISYILLGGIYFAMGSITGLGLGEKEIQTLVTKALGTIWLMTGYYAMTSIIAYGSQSTGLSIAGYLLLSTGVVGGVVSLLSKTRMVRDLLGDISPYIFKNIITMSLIENWNMGIFAPQPTFIALLYIAVSMGIGALIFNRKELSF